MGYTHYWSFNGDLDYDAFQKWKSDFREIVSLSDVQVAKCELNEHNVVLQPVKVAESFIVERRSSQLYSPVSGGSDNFDFCKTRRYPYDKIVTGSLIALKYRILKVGVSTDGSIQNSEGWREGFDLFQKAVLGKDPSDRGRKKLYLKLFL